MAREIKNNPPGIRSFVFLTPEEALKEFGGSIAFVGKSSKPTETPSIDLPTNPHSQKKTQKNRRKSK
jgi:ABC-type molybdate transport system permease subunit